MKGSAWKLFVLALVVMIVAAALVVPVVAGAVARVGGDGSTAARVSERAFVRWRSGCCHVSERVLVRWATGRGLAAAGHECHVSEWSRLRRLSLPA